MLKMLVLSLIFVMCSMMGIIKRQELTGRKKELESFITFAEYAKNEMIYHRRPLDMIIRSENVSCIDKFFNDIASSTEPHILRRYEYAKQKNLKRSALKKEDIQCVDRLFSLLCNACGDEQFKLLDSITSDLKNYRNESIADIEKLGTVYLKMGIAAGAFAVMICI